MDGKRVCSACAKVLTLYNPGKLCFSCQEKQRGSFQVTDGPNYTCEDMCLLLGLNSTDHLRRLSRKGLIPGRMPGIKAHLFRKEVIDAWIRASAEGSKYIKTPSSKAPGAAVRKTIFAGIPILQIAKYFSNLPPAKAYPAPVTSGGASPAKAAGVCGAQPGFGSEPIFAGLHIREAFDLIKRANTRPIR